ncbi:MAG: hypothetical protein KGI38_11930 [Thaumarchaeota archaeon]|nr:hypothetical protein [Nitrososphaerota archaeon]
MSKDGNTDELQEWVERAEAISSQPAPCNCMIHRYHVWHIAKGKEPIKARNGRVITLYEKLSHSQRDMDSFKEGVYRGIWRFEDLVDIPTSEWDHKGRTIAEENEYLRALWEKYHA